MLIAGSIVYWGGNSGVPHHPENGKPPATLLLPDRPNPYGILVARHLEFPEACGYTLRSPQWSLP